MHDAAGRGRTALDHAAGGPAVHPGGEAGRQLDLDRARPAGAQGLAGLPEQHRLVTGVQHLAGAVVHHHHVVVQGEHDAVGAAAGTQVLLQQFELLGTGVGQQGLGDLVRRGLHQGDEQRVGVLPPAGQVHRADRLAGDRMVDRHPGAGEILQVLRVMLMAEDMRGLAALQGGADAVGADEFLGVAEPRRQLDPVEVAFQVGVGGQPGQHHPGRVGQDDADRLPVHVLAQVPEHRHGAAGQRGVQVGVADVGQFDAVRGHVPVPGAPPGCQDRIPHLVRLHWLPGQESLPGLSQPAAFRRAPEAGWHGASCLPPAAGPPNPRGPGCEALFCRCGLPHTITACQRCYVSC